MAGGDVSAAVLYDTGMPSRITLGIVVVAALAWASCGSFDACAPTSGSDEGRPGEIDSGQTDRAGAESCLRDAVRAVYLAGRRSTKWWTSQAGSAPELPSVPTAPDGARRIPTDAASSSAVGLVLGPKAVRLEGEEIHTRDPAGSFSTDAAREIGRIVGDRWTEFTEQFESEDSERDGDQKRELGLYVAASRQLQLSVLRRVVESIPDRVDVYVLVGLGEPVDSNAGGEPPAGVADAETVEELIDRGAGGCEAARRSARRVAGLETEPPAPSSKQLEEAHREAGNLFGRPLGYFRASERHLGQFLVALRECKCEGVDIPALERAWREHTLPLVRKMRALPVDRNRLQENDGDTVGRYVRSQPSTEERPPACLDAVDDVQAWYRYTQIWHRRRAAYLDLPRTSSSSGPIRRGSKLVLEPDGARLYASRFADSSCTQSKEIAELRKERGAYLNKIPLPPTPNTEGSNGDGPGSRELERAREHLRSRAKKREGSDAGDPVGFVYLYAPRTLPVSRVSAWLDAFPDDLRYHLVVADQSHPPPPELSAEVPWVGDLFETVDAHRYSRGRCEPLRRGIQRVAGDCQKLETWLAGELLETSHLLDSSVAKLVADCGCDAVDLEALEALLLEGETPLAPEPGAIPVQLEDLRQIEVDTVNSLADELASDLQ